MAKVIQLTKPLTFTRPQAWDIHPRYVLLIPGEQVTVEAGSWLLELGSQITYDQKVEHLYRLATGETVALDRPLAGEEAEPITDPRAITAMAAFRTLEQAALEDRGVHIEYIDHRSPFRVIKCPLCGQTEFTSVDFAALTCQICNTRFEVRPTAGDPGWVLDANWSQVYYGTARLMLPRSNFLGMYLVFKNSGDPADLSCDDCRCEPGRPNLTTKGDPSLRPGLHTCQIGDVYDWKLSGWAPDYTEYNRQARDTGWEIDGQWWSACAYIRTASLLDDELYALQRLYRRLSEAEEVAGDDLVALNNLLTRSPRKPAVYAGLSGRSIPDMARLRQDERYLLHHWLVTKDGQLEIAWPVWYVVKPVAGKEDAYGHRPIEGWQVIRKDICPHCTERVTAEDMATNVRAALDEVEPHREKGRRHDHCRQTWEAGGWQPYLEAKAQARAAGESEQQETEDT